MENIIPLNGKTPKIQDGAYINPFAVIFGDVEICNGVSLWPDVIIKAEKHKITIGENTILLDGVSVEATNGFPVFIGRKSLIGHRAKLQGCRIDDNVIIGKSVNILEGAVLGEGSVVGADSLIPAGMQVQQRSIVIGVPAKIVGYLGDLEFEEMQKKHEKIKNKGLEYGRWFIAHKR